MKTVLHRVSKGEKDDELLWGTVLGLAFLGIAGWMYLGFPRPICFMREFIGIPCFTCGATWGIQSLFAGNMKAAFFYNPLVFVSIPLLGIFSLYGVIGGLFRWPRLRISNVSPSGKRKIRLGIILLILLNWAWIVWVV